MITIFLDHTRPDFLLTIYLWKFDTPRCFDYPKGALYERTYENPLTYMKLLGSINGNRGQTNILYEMFLGDVYGIDNVRWRTKMLK